MKKIILCGATHGSNFGDSLFAYMFKRISEYKVGDIEVLFTKASDYSKKELGIRSGKYRELFTADGMVYISGGYFGQSHKETIKGSIFRFLTYFKYGLIMIIMRKPVAILGVGAGPLERGFLKKVGVYIFNKAKIVSVRDEQSKKYMELYGVRREIIVTSDSAQAIENEVFNYKRCIPDILKDNKIDGRKKVLVHVTSAQGNQLYRDNIVMAIQETLSKSQEYGFIVTSDSIIDRVHLQRICEMLPKDRTVLYEFNNPIDFLSVISNCDVIVTPKLHVGILGSTYGKAVISFPIHPEKTVRYYEQIGYPNHCKPLYDTTKEDAKKIILECSEERIELPNEIKEKAMKNFQLLEKFISAYII